MSSDNLAGTPWIPPILEGDPLNHVDAFHRGYVTLWRRVIEQLLVDAVAVAKSNDGPMVKIKREGIFFFCEDRTSYHTACNLAGYDPDYLQEALLKIFHAQGLLPENPLPKADQLRYAFERVGGRRTKHMKIRNLLKQVCDTSMHT